MASTIAAVIGYTFSAFSLLLVVVISIFGFIYPNEEGTEI